MRMLSVVGAMSFVVCLGGCMIVESPIRGVMGTKVIGATKPPGSLVPPTPVP